MSTYLSQLGLYRRALIVFRREGRLSEDELTNVMGLMQALISVYADDGDKIRSVLLNEYLSQETGNSTKKGR